jgi:hypothetical protein
MDKPGYNWVLSICAMQRQYKNVSIHNNAEGQLVMGIGHMIHGATANL